MKKLQLRNYPDLLSVKDVQAILRIGRSMAYKLLRSGEIYTLRIGNVYRIPKKSLIQYIEKRG